MIISQRDYNPATFKSYAQSPVVQKRYASARKRGYFQNHRTSRDLNQERIDKENQLLLKKISIIIDNKDAKNKNDIRDIFNRRQKTTRNMIKSNSANFKSAGASGTVSKSA